MSCQYNERPKTLSSNGIDELRTQKKLHCEFRKHKAYSQETDTGSCLTSRTSALLIVSRKLVQVQDWKSQAKLLINLWEEVDSPIFFSSSRVFGGMEPTKLALKFAQIPSRSFCEGFVSGTRTRPN
ncbi:hypothetical protein PoB_003692900 [Plakobranchus ocellatus]|uniref:Uncharacterized protein n=1 Tax=Plakobranchus ocellatus TaxID=259542 RepID=A0AAV4AWC7_9GAST|nr:hypothetical protein PoB_003692900 [Plakobranchus ocellatus]